MLSIFSYVLVIYMSSLEKCLFRSFSHFLIDLFFWYWLIYASCIFWKLILCQLFHLLLFSPILRVVFFTLLIVSFSVLNIFGLIRSHLFTFVFISIILGVGSWKIFLWFVSLSFYFFYFLQPCASKLWKDFYHVHTLCLGFSVWLDPSIYSYLRCLHS